MPLADHDHSDLPDFFWLWLMTAAFAFAALFPELLSDEIRAGLALTLFVDMYGAIVVVAMYSQADFKIDPFKLPIQAAFFLMFMIAMFKALGFDLYAAMALIPLLRLAYDVYAYLRAPFAPPSFHARSFFTIYIQAIIALVILTVLALFLEIPDRPVRQDDPLFQCETTTCRLFSPPDPYSLFGLFLYPLIGWLNFKWRPEWMRWVRAPRHITE